MKSIRLSRAGLATAVVLAVAGCSSAPEKAVVPASARYSGTTLGDLENTDITVKQQSLDNVSPQSALESYRRAVDLFQDPKKRAKSLRRMADLAMESAEDQTGGKDKTGEKQQKGEQKSLKEKPAVSTSGNDELDKSIDKMLYENFMREAKKTKDRQKKYALLDLAGNLRSNLDNINLKGDYQTAIALYQRLLDTTQDPKERADAYYMLAKAYDMAGEVEKSRSALDQLVKQYPNSKYYVEAQFRRGERFFSDGEYDSAASAYGAVVKNGKGTDFYEQSVYKLAWSDYKLGDYKKALGNFFSLMDTLHGSPKIKDPKSMEAKLLSDTSRAISLAFTNLNGADSVKQWFASHGHKDYEPEVYKALGDMYLQQERYRDAANAYDAFVNEYPNSAEAPRFSSLHIQAFEKGGFPSLVLPAKKKFVEHYGIHGQYWAKHPRIREKYVPLLKGHILDLAEHYHAMAQKSGKPKDFDAPIRWYKEYMDTPPPSKDEAHINDLYAQALFSGKHFAEAVKQFEKTAYGYKNYDKSANAAYLALIAYQQEIAALPKDARDKRSKLRQAEIASGLKFAKTFPQHDKVPEVLHSITEEQLAEKDLDGAIETAGLLVNRKPPPPEKLQIYGWTTIANGEFDEKHYPVAEFAYKKLLAFTALPDKARQHARNQIATAIYQQGDALKQAGKPLAAAQMYLRIGQEYPDSSVRKNADYDAATLFLKNDKYKEAIPILEDFRKRYPNDKLTENIPDKLAVAYEKTGNFTAAAGELEKIADRYGEKNKELARQALWQAAEMQDRANRPQRSIELYKKYVWKYQQPYDFRAEAQDRLVKLYEKTGDADKANFWRNQLVKTYNDAGDKANDRVAFLAAQASFQLAETKFQQFSDIKLTQPLKQSLARKTSAMKDALQRYNKILDIGVSQYTTAANYKIAQLYETLATDMKNSERPKGLSEMEKEQYQLLLGEKALPYEDQAIDILIRNTDMVTKGIYDDWVKRSYASLAKLLPGRYAKFEQVENYVDIIY